MKIAITGANGFVGQNCHRYLASQGHTVLALSRPRFNLLDVDANTKRLQGVDVLIHCAAAVHQMDCKRSHKAHFQHTNVYATKQLLEAANRAQVGQFVFLSSIKVHGESTQGEPFSESDEVAPQDEYARTKYAAENILRSNAKIPYTIIRPAMIYGPGMKGNMPRLIRLVQKPILLPLGGICNQRSFLHVFNLCTFIEKCLLQANAYDQVFLLADEQALSTPELIRRLHVQYQGKAKLVNCPLWLLKAMASLVGKKEWLSRLTESLVVNTSKAQRSLAWQPKYHL